MTAALYYSLAACFWYYWLEDKVIAILQSKSWEHDRKSRLKLLGTLTYILLVVDLRHLLTTPTP